MNTSFHQWVADSIQRCGGNGSEYLRGVQRKYALTFTGSRTDACQYGFDLSDEWFSPDLMRFPVIVSANAQTIH